MPSPFSASTPIVRLAVNETTTIFPGVTQQIIVGPATRAGGITAELMEIAPGMCLPPHTHPVEEAITILHGDVRVRVGHEQIEVRGGGFSLLGPANIIHAGRNIGSIPVVLIVAFPTVNVPLRLTDTQF